MIMKGFKLQRYHKSLFCLIKYEINKYIDTDTSKSIYDIPKNAKLLILSRNKLIPLSPFKSISSSIINNWDRINTLGILDEPVRIIPLISDLLLRIERATQEPILCPRTNTDKLGYFVFA